MPAKSHGCSIPLTPEYRAWLSMRARILSVNSSNWSRYGGQGLKIIPRWNQFENFLLDMGPKPSLDHTLDRIDNTQGYSPQNCRWATRKEQQRNRRNTRWLTIGDQTLPAAEWEEVTGILAVTLINRISLGWSVDRILSTNRRHRLFLEWNGQTRSLSEWAKITGIQMRLLSERLKAGWSVERAFTTPPRAFNRNAP